MKNFKNYWGFLALILISFFTGCQSESVVEIYNTNETITKTTPLTSYLERLAMVKTSQDNLIDKSSYCTIKLPYIVTVNNSSIAINAIADYQKVQDNINAYSNDNDIVKINFPVTMVYYNYIEKVIGNQSDFELLLSYWAAKPDLLSKINCLNINYPITINIYNSANQIASTVQFINDQSFFGFIHNLYDSQFIALSFPISIIDNDNHMKSVENNSQLENEIKYAIDNCKENINPSLDFTQILTSNSWKISYYFYETEKTSNYTGYNFTFYSNYKVVATKSGVNYNGTWSTKIDNGVREFEIKMELDLLHELDEDWKLFEFNTSQLRFRHEEGLNENQYLYFEKIN
jgi:hypothetical protein